MKRWLIFGLLGVSFLVASARPADAKIWDWLQEWSGPGPFSSNQPMVLVDLCSADRRRVLTKTESDRPCYFFDVRRLSADANDNFPIKVDLSIWEVGITRRVRIGERISRSITAGVGAGVLVASGDKTAGGKRFVRPFVTAPRIVVKPGLALAELTGFTELDSHRWKYKVLSVFKAYLGGGVIVGPFGAEDLGVSGWDFHRKSEFVVSRGLLFDVGELFSATF